MPASMKGYSRFRIAGHKAQHHRLFDWILSPDYTVFRFAGPKENYE